MSATHFRGFDAVLNRDAAVGLPLSPIEGRSYLLGWNGTGWEWHLRPKFDRFIFSDFYQSTSGLNDPFSGSAIGGGNSTLAPSGAMLDAKHPGVVVLRSAAASNSGYAWGTGTAVSLRVGEGVVFRGSFMVLTSNATVTSRIGLMNSLNATASVNGVWLEINSGTASLSTAKGGVSAVLLGTSLSLNVWYNIEITYRTDDEVNCLVFDDSGAVVIDETVTSGVPNSASELVNFATVAYKTSTGTTPLIAVDYMGFGR